MPHQRCWVIKVLKFSLKKRFSTDSTIAKDFNVPPFSWKDQDGNWMFCCHCHISNMQTSENFVVESTNTFPCLWIATALFHGFKHVKFTATKTDDNHVIHLMSICIFFVWCWMTGSETSFENSIDWEICCSIRCTQQFGLETCSWCLFHIPNTTPVLFALLHSVSMVVVFATDACDDKCDVSFVLLSCNSRAILLLQAAIFTMCLSSDIPRKNKAICMDLGAANKILLTSSAS